MQLGSPDEIYGRPINKYVADFIGSPSMNFLEGNIQNGTFEVGELSIPLGRL
jgi:multiple sugar transport system ATP-binding protein